MKTVTHNLSSSPADLRVGPDAGRLRQWNSVALLALLLMGVLGAGSWFYRSQKQLVRHDVEVNLAAIAQLKADQIATWRRERFGDARVLMGSESFKGAVMRWLAQPDDKLGTQIRTRLHAMEIYNQYRDVLLVDRAGLIRLRVPESAVALHAASRQGLATAWQTRQPVIVDLHVSPDDPLPHIGIIAPLCDEDGRTNEPLAAVILRFEGRKFLFPMIQRWPTDSASAETMLVRREGDSVLFLNELRHQNHTALKLSFPLSQTNSPAVQVALGKEGVFYGTDYRGVRVVAFLKQVPDSPWALVTKIDEAEALADWYYRANLIIAFILALLLALGVTAVVIWREQKRAWELAQTSAEIFDLYEYAPCGYHSLDKDGVFVRINATELAWLGYARDEIIGKKRFSDLLTVPSQAIFQKEFPAFQKLGEVQNVEFELVRKDGTNLTVLLNATAIKDAAGNFRVSWATSVDVTARKQAEQTMRESENKYSRLVEGSPNIIYTFSSQRGGIYYSAHVEAVLGYSVQYLLEHSSLWQASIDPADLERVRLAVQQLASGKAFDIEYRIKDSAGKWHWLQDRSIGRRQVGDEIIIEGIATDITVRKQAEAELRLQSVALAAAANAIVITDSKGTVVWANPAFSKLTGYEVAEVIGQNPRTLKSGQHDAAFYRQMWDTITAGQVWSGEVINRRKNGSLYTEEMTITPVRSEPGEISHFIAIKQDITRRKQAEHALEASNRQLVAAAAELGVAQQQIVQQASLRALGQMASGIAHDFNNALSPIIGFSELLLKFPEKLADQKQAERFLKIINTAGHDAAEVVRRLREFGRKRVAGEISEAIDLPGLVQQTIELTRPRWKDQAQENGLTIQIATDLGKVPLIAGEEFAIRELLTNLVFNAVDALPDGGTIRLGTAVEGGFARVWVSDTGTGMTEEVRLHCLEPFFTTKADKGTGLGLAMVHGIVQRHGGTLEIESQLGQGTTFTIRLPLQPPQCAAGPVATFTVGRRLRVLVVDDEPMLCDIVEAWLTADGHSVGTAASGAAALQRLQSDSFDLVITDKAMPEMNGEQLALILNAIPPGIPVILMSGFGDLMKATGEMPPHICAILSKPITEESLREVLAKVFPA